MGRRPCCAKVGLNQGAWSADEDKLLIDHIQTHGEGQWRSLPSKAGLLRCGKSCRLRWMNYLRPGIKRGNFTSEEDDVIIRLRSLHGNRWSLIATELSGRTDNEIKNRWNAYLRKKQLNNRKAKTTSQEKPKEVQLLNSASASSSSSSCSLLLASSKDESFEHGMPSGASTSSTFDLQHADFDFSWLNSENCFGLENTSTINGHQDDCFLDSWELVMSKEDESLMLEKLYHEYVNLLNHQDVDENINDLN